MTYTEEAIESFLAGVAPFERLSVAQREAIAARSQVRRFKMGQPLLARRGMGQLFVVMEGQVRILGLVGPEQRPVTLAFAGRGEVLGAVDRLRGIACELALASSEVVCLAIEAALEHSGASSLLEAERCRPAEAAALLGGEIKDPARLERLAATARVLNLAPGRHPGGQLESTYSWYVSSAVCPDGTATGERLRGSLLAEGLHLGGAEPARLVGFDRTLLSAGVAPIQGAEVPVAHRNPDGQPPRTTQQSIPQTIQEVTPLAAPQGQEAALACLELLCTHLGLRRRREVLARVLDTQTERSGGEPSLGSLGAVVQWLGLGAQLTRVEVGVFGRLRPPALVQWGSSYALVIEMGEREVVLAVPGEGTRRLSLAQFREYWGSEGPVLLVEVPQVRPQESQGRFGLSWFVPSLGRYRRVLFEVLVASFFVQLFGLANPLIIQVIIDKVLTQKSIDTLQILGVFLLVVAVFEAVLGSLRTYLFAATTNRIDMALGSQVIDHLLRLPLRYFERRPVGELSTRVGELENIRQFLTGTALTAVLDAIFSVLYIVVLFLYNWMLALVALSTIPLFALLTFVLAPVVRRQLRERAERNASTQAYLVEVLSGIQTVKAQNVELRTRWQWQERYARYVSAGFKSVLTLTAAGATSNFLNQLSGLLVLWVGAYLVLSGGLSLGQLIAFRIIAGYVTAPLLRLVQLWQNFQETALSLERLGDIVDTPPEADELDRSNISLPQIQGRVAFEEVSFRFGESGPLQVSNVRLEVPAGAFVGVVGASGSGKSTLLKLLPRLYAPDSGRITVDGYDIAKVELYSLRSQLGLVPQETVLFDGTVAENIALAFPDATADEIVAAARIACAHDFVMELPAGYNTRVGERGASLSGGQRQRIAIARTVLQNPQMLVLDEATSALDYDTERQVCRNLMAAFRGRTVFFVTHRLASVQQADLIVLMHQGMTAELGTHAELMALRGRYWCLVQQQDALAL